MSLLLVGGSATFLFCCYYISQLELFVCENSSCVFTKDFVSVCWNHFSGVGVL